MQVSIKWLNDYVDLSDKTTEEIAHSLTMSGLEVEDIEKTGPKFSNITTALIKKISNHPNADKLHLVTLDTYLGEKTVVCGAQNIEEGQIIPYATIGSKVFSRKTNELYELTPAAIRGVVSEGMLCSQDELGLSGLQQEDGILILNKLLEKIELNQPLEKVLNIEEDEILHLAPTANRGDQMSVVGVARELAALFDKKMNFSHIECINKNKKTDFKVEIIDEDVCKYYAIGVLKNVKLKPSPQWLQYRLESSGVRSINNVVDITNYVLLEYGQPLHAFDLDKLDNYLCVRRAKENETIITLDEVERKLTKDSVLIADKTKGVCVAGVFGGANSEVDENTKNLALESAYFMPATTRKSARSIGYRSEASARFERGVDLEAVKPALNRAISLLQELADAEFEGFVETGSNEIEEIAITLRFSQVEKVLGCKIPSEKCCTILEKLGFELLGKNEIAAKFKVPGFRINDVTREIDLIEEIARIYGYDKIEPTLPNKTNSVCFDLENNLINHIHNLFTGQGFSEIVTSSLIGEPLLNQFGLDYDKETTVSVINYQSEEYKMLRQSLIPSILQVAKYNFDNGQKNLWFFEFGKTYFKETQADEKNTGVVEKRHIAGLMTGDVTEGKWFDKNAPSFYSLKGVLENIFEELKLTSRIKYANSNEKSYFHPGICAKITLLGKNPITVGYVGLLHPNLKKKMKLQQDLFLFDINIDVLFEAYNNSTVKFKKLPQYPEVQRDIAFIVPENISNEEIERTIKKKISSNLFKGSELFDLYQGENISVGSKSMAYRIKLQDANATLTDEIVEKEMNNLRNGLKTAFAGLAFRE